MSLLDMGEVNKGEDLRNSATVPFERKHVDSETEVGH